MNGQISGLAGYNDAQHNTARYAEAPTPASPYEDAATHWKLNAERLERARQALGAAEQELREATDGERAAWNDLECISGRAKPQTLAAAGVAYRK
jgi:uncharacterized membrane protein